MKSLWEKSTAPEKRKALQQNRKADTVVIGAGMAGILIAYFLKKRGKQAIVVEADRIGSGQTGRTTAKITSQHAAIYHKLIHKAGRKRAEAYARANENAIRLYEQIVQEEKIECHFERLPAYLYTVTEDGVKTLKKEEKAAADLGIRVHFTEGSKVTELPFSVKGALCFEEQAQFHPLEFIKQLAKQLEIYETTKVLAVKGHTVFTNQGKIEAKNIVFATHYPIVDIPGFYFLRQHQERSYVLALKNPPKLSGMYYSVDENGLSLRSEEEFLLLGGGGHRTGKAVYTDGGHRTGKKCCEKSAAQKAGYTWLREQAAAFYPDAQETAAWSAQDCMPHDEIPLIGKYSVFRPYWYVATGFKKWGMTSAMVAAVLISQQICSVTEEERKTDPTRIRLEDISFQDQILKTFSPQRLLLRAGIVNFFKDVKESTVGLSKGLFGDKECRCSHLGCRLEWNPEEDRWECPCHGSGFSESGKLLDDPAIEDIGRIHKRYRKGLGKSR